MIDVLGYPLDRAVALLAALGVHAEVCVIARGGAPATGVLRVVRQAGAALTAVSFVDAQPPRREP